MEKTVNEKWYGAIDPAQLSAGQQIAYRLMNHIHRVSTAAAALAALLCALLAVVTTVLVLFGMLNMVSNAWEELKWHLCGALFLLSGAYCFKHNAHVRVDTFYERFSVRTRALIDLIGMLFLFYPAMCMVMYYGFFMSYEALVHAEASNDAGGLSSRWIIKSIIPLGFLLLSLQGVSVVLRCLLHLSLPAPKERVNG